jgi:2-polyprenyl-3-methyl-5-hydroxy-6-metoxy-1,4-benzoquinol methylase
MFDTHHQFWNQWSTAYQGFSETVEPYRAAQRSLAQGAIAALAENLDRPNLSILDVGGGAGNLIRPLLDALVERRQHLKGVSYTLTDGAKDMTGLAQKRLPSLQKSFPEVDFRILHVDTLADDFHDNVEKELADVVISSWNIEYYPLEKRREIVQRLVHLAHPQGVVAFSSSVHLPGELGIRDVLMPLGQAQVLQALLTGGPTQMKKVITSLKQIAEFGVAVNDCQFPKKPCLNEMKELAEQAGLFSVSAGYHLFGASGMVVARKDSLMLPALPKTPISQPLSGLAGYEEYSEAVSFWSYFIFLLRNRPGLQ